MKNEARQGLLPDGKRLHLQHGPIDIVAESSGATEEIKQSYHLGYERFRTILEELAGELQLLHRPVETGTCLVQGKVALRMVRAVEGYREFITPMAAVAGAVADEVLHAMTSGLRLRRTYVNNGGDIAFYIGADESYRIAVVDNPSQPELNAEVLILHGDPVRGTATSGWRGRSLSQGIADAVTVLAGNAASADAAATLIAGEVQADFPGIRRKPANQLVDDSDLQDRLVTTHVPPLPEEIIWQALDRGACYANDLKNAGVIHAAYLALQGKTRTINGPLNLQEK